MLWCDHEFDNKINDKHHLSIADGMIWREDNIWIQLLKKKGLVRRCDELPSELASQLNIAWGFDSPWSTGSVQSLPAWPSLLKRPGLAIFDAGPSWRGSGQRCPSSVPVEVFNGLTWPPRCPATPPVSRFTGAGLSSHRRVCFLRPAASPHRLLRAVNFFIIDRHASPTLPPGGDTLSCFLVALFYSLMFEQYWLCSVTAVGLESHCETTVAFEAWNYLVLLSYESFQVDKC